MIPGWLRKRREAEEDAREVKAMQHVGVLMDFKEDSVAEDLKHDDVFEAIAVVAPSAELSRFLPVMTIEQAVQRRELVVQATQRLMKVDVDFGVIPGTGTKPTLLQPGADKLCNLFGLVIQYDVITSDEDWDGSRHGGEPFFYYRIKGRAYRGDYLMGEGVGSCSSWETKYRWRKSERVCPECGKSTIIQGKAEYGGGWLCFAKRGGCGAKFKTSDPKIADQAVGRVPNPDIADLPNTLLKMAYRRAKVSATVNATSASEFFTQDLEEQAPVDAQPSGKVSKAKEHVDTETGEVTTDPPEKKAQVVTAWDRVPADLKPRIQNGFEALRMPAGLRLTKVNEFLPPDADPSLGAHALLTWLTLEYKRAKNKPATVDNGKQTAPPADSPSASVAHPESSRGPADPTAKASASGNLLGGDTPARPSADEVFKKSPSVDLPSDSSWGF